MFLVTVIALAALLLILSLAEAVAKKLRHQKEKETIHGDGSFSLSSISLYITQHST